MTNKYREITSDYSYKMAIYDNCGYSIERNNKRFRVTYDEIYWSNNNGGLRTKTVYLTRQHGRAVLKALRCARATWELGNSRGFSPLEIISDQLTSNWSNQANPSVGIN